MAPRGNTTGPHETAAKKAVEAANRKINGITARLAAGKQIDPTELMTARAELEIADAGISPARSRDLADRRAAAQEQVEAIFAEADATEAPDVAALVREVHTAVSALDDALTAHNVHVRRWTRALIGLEAIGPGSLGFTTTTGTRHTVQTISAALNDVFVVSTRGREQRPVIELKTRNGDHVEKAATRAPREPFDPNDGDKIKPRPVNDQYAAEQAAYYRYLKEQGLPFEANRPNVRFPKWIKDADLIALVPSVESLNPDGEARPGVVIADAPIRT